MSEEKPKERYLPELIVEEYFGLPDTMIETNDIKTDYGQLVGLVVLALEKYSSLNEWISVEDRLPENKQVIHCFGICSIHDKEGKVYRARFYKGDECNKQSWIHGPVEVKNVTHWMPLPKPPIP